ncbi:hypothetical protein B0I35DRAFT_431215 [Stachybotrys elegans]|uniref:PD-(D/E)XK nuclease-like domain-containing protein n=1 Tax=Stachybotrys elegans TaxID=80388 RepID=A0A8K0SUG9_9HYPO|nr:hypothetical protein B0I35DRAFT_431215 [Stachybotrys elegans]
MRNSDIVQSWLSSLPPIEANKQDTPYPIKRSRAFVSPPISMDRQRSPSKRRRGDGDDTDMAGHEYPREDATPRPPRSTRLTDALPSIASSYRTGSSRSSSPRKQLFGLSNLPEGQGGAEVCTLDIEDERMPAELVDLLLRLEKQAPILDQQMRTEFEGHYRATRAAQRWMDPNLYGEERGNIGPTPSPDFVDDIVQQARECDRFLLDEGAWSHMVYYPLLRCIFNSRRRANMDELVVVPCSSASIDPRYRMAAAPFKKVDFAIAYTPRDASASNHLRLLMQADPAPDPSLNHTSYLGLCGRPIALSVEVKRTTDSTDTAKLQLLTWLGSQWKKLDELFPPPSSQSSSSKQPAYILSLLIQGHDWSLVASSRDSDTKRVLLWHKFPIGDTQTALGVYKIVQKVQELAQIALVPYCQMFQPVGHGQDINLLEA